jgi:hypothetical protein
MEELVRMFYIIVFFQYHDVINQYVDTLFEKLINPFQAQDVILHVLQDVEAQSSSLNF